MRLLFNKGPLFYAEYNIRAFLFMLIHPCDVIVSNDLDTLLACRLAQKLKRCELIYDTHEFFTEVPELAGRSARKVWLAIERRIFPKLAHVITVNDSIAEAYQHRYGVRPKVVKNLGNRPLIPQYAQREDLGLPADSFVIILQGSGINIDRGAEEAVAAMQGLKGVLLLIIGAGDAWPTLQRMVEEMNLQSSVRMIDRRPFEQMMNYTNNADVGLSLDKNTNLNYRYSLPNKLFDYLYAGIPVIASDLPEVGAVIRKYDAGVLLPAVTVEAVRNAILSLSSDPQELSRLKQNAKFAASELDPVSERVKLKEVIQNLER
jgi:glycosyltransferase involved in cell wall biosynthesis